MKIALLVPSPLNCGGFVSFTNHLYRSIISKGINTNLFVMTKSGRKSKKTEEHIYPVGKDDKGNVVYKYNYKKAKI